MHEEVMMFLVGNTNSVGGFEKLAPEASMNDGLFDVLILKKCNLAEFIRVVYARAARRASERSESDLFPNESYRD